MVKNRPAPPHAHGAAALLRTLRTRIARHELPPGAKLLENELSREFGVSRALNMLSHRMRFGYPLAEVVIGG